MNQGTFSSLVTIRIPAPSTIRNGPTAMTSTSGIPCCLLKLREVLLGILYVTVTVAVFDITLPRKRIRNRNQPRREARERELVCLSSSVCASLPLSFRLFVASVVREWACQCAVQARVWDVSPL